MAKTYEFIGPDLSKISSSGGVSHSSEFTCRVPSTEGLIEWSGVTVGTQKTVEDVRMIKVLDVSPNWQEVIA